MVSAFSQCRMSTKPHNTSNRQTLLLLFGFWKWNKSIKNIAVQRNGQKYRNKHNVEVGVCSLSHVISILLAFTSSLAIVLETPLIQFRIQLKTYLFSNNPVLIKGTKSWSVFSYIFGHTYLYEKHMPFQSHLKLLTPTSENTQEAVSQRRMGIFTENLYNRREGFATFLPSSCCIICWN